jgi:hypothetical protein
MRGRVWRRRDQRGDGRAAAPAAALTRMVAVLFCAALVLAACGRQPGASGPAAQGDGPPAEQQVLRLLTLNMPRSLDPVHIDSQRITSDGLAEPLVWLNDDATLRPGLARSGRWRAAPPGAGGRRRRGACCS